MRLADAGHQRLQRRKFIVAGAQAVARLTGVDRVGTEIESGVHLGERAGGKQEFWGAEHDRGISGKSGGGRNYTKAHRARAGAPERRQPEIRRGRLQRNVGEFPIQMFGDGVRVDDFTRSGVAQREHADYFCVGGKNRQMPEAAFLHQ